MTIKQAFRLLHADTNGLIYKPTFDINFIDDSGDVSETQFTANSFKSAVNELNEFFTDFCQYNGYKANSVISITLVNYS
ncbi:hypothetical protein KQI61_15415 [Anaerocolumna aminovalerica]|uniref:hypothetical protein n=1 Tax=Anaerocolumna aminovalerica TaxID=1527 RepID=UPI001C0E9EC6|nr:hypothetical protein [Anaerocolumna aminovalerica]MBU5333587.1 hypothetical protein [Anaerocolumna aminovalerica]